MLYRYNFIYRDKPNSALTTLLPCPLNRLLKIKTSKPDSVAVGAIAKSIARLVWLGSEKALTFSKCSTLNFRVSSHAFISACCDLENLSFNHRVLLYNITLHDANIFHIQSPSGGKCQTRMLAPLNAGSRRFLRLTHPTPYSVELFSVKGVLLIQCVSSKQGLIAAIVLGANGGQCRATRSRC